MPKDLYYFEKLLYKYRRQKNEDGERAMEEVIKRFKPKKGDKQMRLK